MKIAVIGTGYVGLVTAVCLAEIGHHVTGIDSNKKKIELLKKGKIPIYEPGLDKLLKKNKKRLVFTTSISEGTKNAVVIFIAVNTPPRADGSADMQYVEEVSRQIAKEMTSYKVIVEKSTVPVETGKWVKKVINLYNRKNVPFDVVSNPEFLREGQAVNDFLHPDRVVVGAGSKRAQDVMDELYRPIKAPKLFTSVETAEIIKHASNSFLATKISYINAVSRICEKVGADIEEVAEGMGMDKRIGRSFLKAGAGYGGSCFPKDASAFIWIAKKAGYDFNLLKEVEKINRGQRDMIVEKLENALWNLNGKTIGVLGIAFKPDTDDIRESPSVAVIKILLEEKARVKTYDPEAMKKAREVLKGVKFCSSPYEAARDSEALVLLTEWEEFRKMDLSKIKKLMKVPVFIDGRNLFKNKEMRSLGFIYQGVGR